MYLILTVLISIFFLVSCQLTPENEIVAQKNTKKMLDMAMDTKNSTKISSIEVPERLKADFTGSDGKTTIKSDATIQLPNTNILPVTRVVAADFTQEVIDSFHNLFLANTEMYDVQTQMTKSEIEESIVYWRRVINTYPELEEQIIPDINALEEAYPNAPEYIEKNPSDFQLRIMESYLPGQSLVSEHNIGLHVSEMKDSQGQERSFQVTNNSGRQKPLRNEYADGSIETFPVRKGAVLVYMDNRLGKIDIVYQPIRTVTGETTVDAIAEDYLSLTPVQAQENVENLIEELGAQLAVAEVLLLGNGQTDEAGFIVKEPTAYAYAVRCVSTAGGVPCIRLAVPMILPDKEFGGTWGSWQHETMGIGIDDSGIYTISWTSPHEVVDTVIEDAKILPFDDIMDRFEQMMIAKYSHFTTGSGEPIKAVDISIDQVVLAYMRIAEQDSFDSGLLVPVWSFHGIRTVSYDAKDSVPWVFDSYSEGVPILIINAIDGTIIDPELGY